MDIERLRKFAELNLCKDCYQKYLALIEPSIKHFAFKPLDDWRNVESYITQMAMKHFGIFKGDTIIISLDKDEDEKYADQVDVKSFHKLEKWPFKKKIEYLHKHGILQDASYSLLYMVSDVRNRIHDWFQEFSEQDLALFGWASSIASQIYSATTINWPTDICANMKSNAENTAEWLLKKTDSHYGDAGSEISSRKDQ